MRAQMTILLFAFAGLTVSCAHKPTHKQANQKLEKKVEKVKIKSHKQEIAYTCLVGKDHRTVTLDKKAKRCEVHYTKFGDIQQVAWAENTPSICDRAFNNIRSNIEGSGYKCMEGTTFKLDKKEAKKPVETAANTEK